MFWTKIQTRNKYDGTASRVQDWNRNSVYWAPYISFSLLQGICRYIKGKKGGHMLTLKFAIIKNCSVSQVVYNPTQTTDVTMATTNSKRKYEKISRSGSHFFQNTQTWSFHVALQRTAKKCTKIYSTHAKPLFCLLSLLFAGAIELPCAS